MVSIEEAEKFWASVNVDGRRIEIIYSMILNGVPKDKAPLKNDDEKKAWDFIKADIDSDDLPEGVIYEVPADL